MLFRNNRLILKFLHCPKQLISNFQFKRCHYYYKRSYYREMPPQAEAHIRLLENGDKFNLLFSLSSEKQDNMKMVQFERNVQEPLEKVIQRISNKVNNTVRSKKGKKNLPEMSDTSPISEIPIYFMKNGEPVSNETIFSDFFQDYENQELMLKIGDQEFQIFINHPYVQNIILPSVLLAGFPAYPFKFMLCYAEEDECKYLWYKQETNDGRTKSDCIHSGYMYIPTSQDIGYYLTLTCTPKRGNIVGESVVTMSNTVVEAGPGQSFSDIRHSFTKDSLVEDSFRVVSYNILADLYATSSIGKTELFAYCPAYAINGNYRKLLLLKELLGYNADLICLQEVDCTLFKRDLTQVLSRVGLEGVFAKKGAEVNEGVACFYKKSRFKLIDNYSLLLGEQSREKPYVKNIWEKVSSNENLIDFLKNLSTTVQVLVFEYVEKPKHKLIVANTHLYFRPDADVIRMLQAGICLNLVNHVKNTVAELDPSSKISVVFCGDFNSTPECGVFHLFTKNHVPEDYHEWKHGPPELRIEGLSLQNSIKFDSACGTPEFTNFTAGFEGCLDYIFYNTDFLQVEQVLPFPTREEVSEHIAIPSVVFPSDHIALVADLKWRK